MRARWLPLVLVPMLGVRAAQPADALIRGSAAVNVVRVSGGFSVCVHGHVDPLQVTGSWTFTVQGVRGTSAYAPPPVNFFTPDVVYCTVVSKASTVVGSLLFTMSYAGVGLDVAAGAVGGAVWAHELRDDIVFGTSN